MKEASWFPIYRRTRQESTKKEAMRLAARPRGRSGVSNSAQRGLYTGRSCCAGALQPGIPIARDAIACCSPGCWNRKFC